MKRFFPRAAGLRAVSGARKTYYGVSNAIVFGCISKTVWWEFPESAWGRKQSRGLSTARRSLRSLRLRSRWQGKGMTGGKAYAQRSGAENLETWAMCENEIVPAMALSRCTISCRKSCRFGLTA